MPHYLNDPAWYYMYKAYVFEGIWIHEELYPSFKEPVLYHCSLGYPLLLYISGGISSLFGCSFAAVLLQIQFVVYLLSARFLWLICLPYSGKTITTCMVLVFLWFMPFFNYAHLVMSESWFIGCLLATIYVFIKAIKSEKRSLLILSFLLAGYTFLIRPVGGLLFPVMLTILFSSATGPKKKLLVSGFSLLFFVLPIVQSGFNKVVFSTWTIREGFSWNVWNRIVAEDGFDPNSSLATTQLRKKLNDSSFIASNGHWWDITFQLSAKGIQAKEIQDYCMSICKDGFKAHPFRYAAITLQRGLWELPTVTHETFYIYPEGKQYSDYLRSYSSKHHDPLLKVLNAQNFEGNSFSGFLLKVYSAWNSLFLKLNTRFVYILLYLIVIAASISWLIRFLKTRKVEPLRLLLVFLSLGISTAACAFEILHDRYYLPVIVLNVMIAGIFLTQLLNRKATKKSL
jgi:hypothetical protein